MQIPGRRFSNNDKILTDWAPRGGDNMIIRADRVASTASGSCRVTIRVITKNADESGEGVPIHSSTNPVSFQVLNSNDSRCSILASGETHAGTVKAYWAVAIAPSGMKTFQIRCRCPWIPAEPM